MSNYGNDSFKQVANVASVNTQRLQADNVVATNLRLSVSTVAPTGPTGPYKNVANAGDVVLAMTGALGSGGAGPYLGMYNGANWFYTNLSR